MGVVIEICVKYPGGPTRNKGTDIHANTNTNVSGLLSYSFFSPHLNFDCCVYIYVVLHTVLLCIAQPVQMYGYRLRLRHAYYAVNTPRIPNRSMHDINMCI